MNSSKQRSRLSAALRRKTTPARDLTREIAAPTLGGVRSYMTGYPADGLTPSRLASLLRSADDGDPVQFLELAELIEERDPHYAGVLATRKRAVSQLEITVDAASDDKADTDIAAWVRKWIERDTLQGELFDILDAIGKGISYTEIIWDRQDGSWIPARLEWRRPEWFEFDREDGVTPLLKTDNGPQPLPFAKFIVTRIAAKSGLPLRSGIARLAVWTYMFKKFTERDWAIFVQTYGQPIRVGKYGPDASEEEKETLFRAVSNIAGDCAAIIPDSMVLEFIDAANAAAAHEIYMQRADWLDQQVSKVVLGQTTTTDAISGGHAVSKEHNEVREDIKNADSVALAAILNEQLIRVAVDLEFGPRDVYPQITIGQPDSRDPKETLAALGPMIDRGLKVRSDEVRDLLGFSEPAEDDEVLSARKSGGLLPETDPDTEGNPPQAKVASGHSQEKRHSGLDVPGLIVRDAEDLVADAGDKVIDEIRALIDQAGSMEDIRDGLLSLRPEMDPATLADELRKALVLAELTGRSEIVTDG